MHFGGFPHNRSGSVYGSRINSDKSSPTGKAVSDHSRSIQVATAKAKLRGFARALVSSTANAKHYFAAGSKIVRLAHEAEEEERRAAALLGETAAAAEERAEAADEAEEEEEEEGAEGADDDLMKERTENSKI